MKRTITTALLTTALAVGTNAAAAGVQIDGGIPPRSTSSPQHHTAKPQHDRWIGPCQGWRLGENLTPATFDADPARGALKIKRLIACVFALLAPGQSVTALIVADRESHYRPWAFNPSSGASGLFQHIASYWPGRAAALGHHRGWFGKGSWPLSPFNARANAMVTAIMTRNGDWSPWSM